MLECLRPPLIARILQRQQRFPRAPALFGALLLCLLLAPVSGGARAQDAVAPETGICADERLLVERAQAYATTVLSTVELIEAGISGEASGTLRADQLLDALNRDREEGDLAENVWPDEVTCVGLREAYTAARIEAVASEARLAELREGFWLQLPETGREGLRRLLDSSRRLYTHVPEDSPSRIEEPLREALAEPLAELARLRSAYTALLGSLDGDLSSAEIGTWLRRWRASLDFVVDFAAPPPERLRGLNGYEQDELRRIYRHLQLDASNIAIVYNRVRAFLWSEYREAFLAAIESSGGRAQLLLDESRALLNALHWVYLDARVGDFSSEHRNRAVVLRLLQGGEHLLGLGALALLVWVARRARALAESWQTEFARRSRNNRSRAQLVRLTGGLPPWLPWLIGWYGLVLLEQRFLAYDLVLLLPLLPFARLYVVYGLVRLSGEWFLQRLLELAGVYANDEQRRAIHAGARRAARIVLAPWLLRELYQLAIRDSLTLLLLDLLTLLALLLAFGVLLRPWRKEFVKALQYFLPERLDTICERLFGGPGFLLLAPLTAPILVLMTILSFIHKVLSQFDWYRRLVARSFLLRSAAPEASEAQTSDPNALADYERWFCEDAVGEAPFIRAGITEQLLQQVQAWRSDQADENTLLLYGEQGSGKSTAVRRLVETLADEEASPELISLEVPARTTNAGAVHALLGRALGVSLEDGPAELIRTDEDRPPTIVIIDQAQNLFLRCVGGLEGWEALLTITRSRLRNVFWLIAIDSQSWAYLANVFGRYYQFHTLLGCKPWSQSDIRSLILSRNQLSGYRITYDQILLSSRGPEAGSLRNAEQLYFSLLWDACHGNPGLALELWLSSLVVRKDEVTVGLPDEISSGALERLEEDPYFVYASLVLHENVSTDELVESTAIAESRVRAALRTGFDLGFLQRSEGRRYRVRLVWYHAVTRLLARKNLLHE